MNVNASPGRKTYTPLRLAVPLSAFLTAAAGVAVTKTSFDTSVRGGYFARGAVLPFVFLGLLFITAAVVVTLACVQFTGSDPADANVYYSGSRVLGLLPTLGLLLCLWQTVTTAGITLKSALPLLFLGCGIVYFLSFFAPVRNATYRYVFGLAFLVWPVIRLAASYLDWYVPLNAPLKLMYQFTFVFIALFLCEEILVLNGAPNARILSACSGITCVLSFTLAAMLLCGDVADVIAGGTETVCAFFCFGFYAGARWFLLTSPQKEHTDDPPTQTQETTEEDEHHAG